MTENLLDPEERRRKIDQALDRFEKRNRAKKYSKTFKGYSRCRPTPAPPEALVRRANFPNIEAAAEALKRVPVGTAVGKMDTYDEQCSYNSYL
jgi:hypothetical protein